MFELSYAERVVLESLAEGLHSKEIAARLRCSRATVELTVRQLYAKLDARTRPQLVARSLRNGVLRNSIGTLAKVI
ncbi:MAG: response regulator transcription factor [Vulcanimicrobiaceae bacterium]|jgi:DNA-binding CsgD family transcriptional regulator